MNRKTNYVHTFQRVNIFKASILSKEVYRLNAIPVKISMLIFIGIKK